jgi:hypothetical protein
MTRDDLPHLLQENGLNALLVANLDCLDLLERFAALVAATEREKVAQWMIEHGYATGHGDTIEDLLTELGWQIADGWNRALMNGVKTEREQCAKVCDDMVLYTGFDCASAIRARGSNG